MKSSLLKASLCLLLSSVAAIGAVPMPQLVLANCSSSPSQVFSYYTPNASYLSNGNCIDILAYGVTAGSEAYTAPCHHEDTDPTHQNQEFSAPSRSAPGALIVETMSGLSLDISGGGPAAVGSPIVLGPGSAFYMDSAAGSPGRLVHVASGLCIDAGSPPLPGPAAVLRACDDARAAWQLLSSNAVPGGLSLVTPDLQSGSIQCLTMGGAAPPPPPVGGAPLAASACTTPLSPAQAFTVDGSGHILAGGGGSPLAVDAGGSVGPYYIGLPSTLAPPASTNAFIINGSAAAARYIHAPSGLCLDFGNLPWGHACLDPSQRPLPYCNASAPLNARIADLLSRMSLPEKVGLTGSGLWSNGVSSCDTVDPGVPRLSIPPKQWLVETNSMAASQCYGGTCATAFPSALNLAASGNTTLWAEKGRVVSDEMRSLNNLAWHRADGGVSYSGLNGFGPDSNNPRDPRNGRVGELCSEDPYIAGEYAVAYITAAQGGSPDAAYMKQTLGIKHYAGYSMETNRFDSKGNFSFFDLWDTYLIPFEAAFTRAGAAGSMCSYISLAIEGGPPIPACADSYILQTVVREYWGQSLAYHTSDCGAVAHMVDKGYAANNTYAAADALNGGMDLNSNTILPSELVLAIQLNLTTEAILDTSLERTLSWRFKLGQMDPLELQPGLQSYGLATLGTAANRAIAAEGAAQGLVLVKNSGGVLPLSASTGGLSIAVIGPLANATHALMGDYYADAVCPGSNGYSNSVGYGCIPTLYNSIAALNPGGQTSYVLGVSISSNDSSWGAAIAAAVAADVTIIAIGTDQTVAGEGTDLSDTKLPGVQEQFTLAVLAALAANSSKKAVVLFVSQFPLALEDIVPVAPAVVLTYTPSFGAPQVAAALFGTNRWGRSMLTHYPHAYISAVALDDFSIVPTPVNPGRTYRYYNGSVGAPSIVFGQGLSYNTLSLSCALDASMPSPNGGQQLPPSTTCGVTVLTGPAGDTVLHAYHRVSSDIIGRINGSHPIPLSTLVGFVRIAIPAASPASPVNATVPLSADAFTLVDETGARVLYQGTHYLDIWDGSLNNITIAVEVAEEDRIVRAPPPITKKY